MHSVSQQLTTTVYNMWPLIRTSSCLRWWQALHHPIVAILRLASAEAVIACLRFWTNELGFESTMGGEDALKTHELRKALVRCHVRAMWESCIYGVVLLLHMIVRLVDGSHVRALRQSLCFLTVHAFCGPSSSCARPSSSQWRVPLLPPRIGRDDEELTVVLDLDETLVCAYDSSGLPPGLHNQAVNAGMSWFQLQCIAAEKDREGKPKINHVTVYERPGLRDFLTRTSKFAELVLFTAGLEGYARPLIDKIDPENRITARLYRPSTVVTKYREHVKDLSRLGRDLKRTVIIDNNPCSFLLQPLNGIPCVPFTADNPDDHQLLEVLLPLLEHLSVQEDVRPILDERFHISAWFHSRGFFDENHF